MNIRPKYKLSDRVIFLDPQGGEVLATIHSIQIRLDEESTKIIYWTKTLPGQPEVNLNPAAQKNNKISFTEEQILGKVSVQKPRTRQKKSESRISHSAATVSGEITRRNGVA